IQHLPNSSGFDQFQPPQLPAIHQSPQETDKEILQAREDLMEAIEAFLKEYDHIPPNEKCMALLLAEERFLKIKQEEHNQPEVMQELLLKLMNDLQILKGIQPSRRSRQFKVLLQDIQELMSKLLEDVRNINEELSEYINCPRWNRPTFYDDDDDEYTVIYRKPKAITPYLPIENPDNSLIMGDEHLDTILETESDEIIKSSVEILVPILSEFEGISEDTYDMPVCEDPSTFDALNDHSEILSDFNDDGTSSDDDDFEDIEYVSLEDVNDVDQEEKEFDLEDILQIQDVILREKLLNISRLITNIKSLNDNPTLDHEFKYPSSFHIPVTDSDSFFEKSDTSLSYSDKSLPEFEPFSDDTEETRKEVDTFLVPEDSIPPGIESDFDSEGDIVFLDNLLNDDPIPEYEHFTFDIEPDAPVINNFDELNEDECFDPRGGEIVFSPTIKDDESFTFVIRTFLPYLTYPEDSPLLLSTGSEDTIFDLGIST
ncbi:hypothetical protein Tco_0913092, partial [Tanacetum coccineum]